MRMRDSRKGRLLRMRNLDFWWDKKHRSMNHWNGQMDELCAGSFPCFKDLNGQMDVPSS